MADSPQIAEVRMHVLSDYVRGQTRSLDENVAEVTASENFRRRYYAFTCLLWHPGIARLICGHTNFGNDLLHAFDPETGEFRCLGYGEFAEPYEIKIHRSLELGPDGCVYGATSCLHDVDKRLDAPGGKVFKWDPETAEFTLLSVPCPHDYIQTITLDGERGMIYGMSYPVFGFFAYSIEKDEVVYSQFMGSITHVGAVDEDGGYWGTWGRAHHLFRYDPGENRCEFFNHGLPSECESLMYPGAGPIDSMIAASDGLLYIGSEKCEIYTVDPSTAEVAYVGKPLPTNRCPGLVEDDEGLLYGVGGNDNDVRVFTYDRSSNAFDIIGILRDTATDEPCFRPHDLAKVGNSLFIGETDHPERSDRLWECVLEPPAGAG